MVISKNKNLFPDDFFNKPEIEKKLNFEEIEENCKLINSKLNDDSKKDNLDFMRSIKNSKKFIRMLSYKNVIPDRINELNVIHEEDEEKLRNSTKKEFFKIKFDQQEKCVNTERKPSGNDRFSSILNYNVFFPPNIEPSDSFIKNEIISTYEEKESLCDINKFNSESKILKSHNISSNETSVNSYNTKSKNIHSKSLRVNIDMNSNSNITENYTPKSEEKSFFPDNNELISPNLKSTRNCIERLDQDIIILEKRLFTEDSRNKKKSHFFSIEKNNPVKTMTEQLPPIKSTHNIRKDFNKILIACDEFKEDPIINKKLCNIIKNIDEIKNVMKTKSKINHGKELDKASNSSLALKKKDSKDESILTTNSKYPKTEKKKMINFIKETKKIPKFNKNNILNLPMKFSEKDVNF